MGYFGLHFTTRLTRISSFLLLLLPACNKPKQEAPPPVRDEDNPVMKLPEAYQDKDGLVSLTFDIAKYTNPKKWGGSTPMTLEARHKYTVMRFDIIVGPHAVSFLGGGTADQFYQVLDELFGTNRPRPLGMRALAKFDAEVLEGNPLELDKGPAKILVKQINGARFLLLINLKEKKAEIREIDKTHREQIMDAFKI